MMKLTVIGIQRDEIFSPNSADKDRAILEAVVNPLGGTIVSESDVASGAIELPIDETTIIYTMARSKEALSRLKEAEDGGAVVINPAEGVANCQRSRLDALMRKHHLPLPPDCGNDGYWLKRGDAAAQSHDDVVFCKDEEALRQAKEAMKARGIDDIIVQAHVKGDLVKFYGVEPSAFFRTFYPGDDGESKFGDEAINGKPHHIFYQKEHLRAVAEYLSRIARVPVYGGDAIVKPDGDFVIIDFNDWPSFSRCREEAAKAIREIK